jgi:hypothetical protein
MWRKRDHLEVGKCQARRRTGVRCLKAVCTLYALSLPVWKLRVLGKRLIHFSLSPSRILGWALEEKTLRE